MQQPSYRMLHITYLDTMTAAKCNTNFESSSSALDVTLTTSFEAKVRKHTWVAKETKNRSKMLDLSKGFTFLLHRYKRSIVILPYTPFHSNI